jgi:hypothetical protein
MGDFEAHINVVEGSYPKGGMSGRAVEVMINETLAMDLGFR